jgi:hypothetical protein
MQSCVDEAWFQRPDQQQGPFYLGGGKWQEMNGKPLAYGGLLT